MANETFFTSLPEIFRTEEIAEGVQSLSRAATVALGLAQQKPLTIPTDKARFVRRDTAGTIVSPAESATVAGETYSLAQLEVTVGENAIGRKLSNKLRVLQGAQFEELKQVILAEDMKDLLLAVDDDLIGLFASFTDSVGASNQDLTADSFASAIADIDTANAHIPGRKLVAVLHPHGVDQVRRDALSSGAFALAQAAADMFKPNQQVPGVAYEFLSIPVFQSTLVDQTGDTLGWVGAMFPAANSVNDREAPLALVSAGSINVEALHNPETRITSVVTSYFWGQGLSNAGRGTRIIGQKN